ncbi:MAG: methylmalonyl-CoA mutase family protein, partial [Candidatus Methanomethylicia archaeon]
MEKIVGPLLKKNPERREFKCESGLVIQRLYTPLDLAEKGWSYLEKLSFPGAYPYTRGVYPTMYRGRIWTIRQYAGYGSAEDSNERFKYLLKVGQT